MADLLRKKTSYAYGCCGHCARGRRRVSPGPRERRMARAQEKRQWKRDADRD